VSALHIADTGFFVALGDSSNERYRRVRTFAKRNEIVFLVPERIYGELIGTEDGEIDEAEAIPIDVAIDDGWVRVADPLEYTNPIVSKTMDGIQRYIANADERLADEIERADPALGALAAQVLSSGNTTHTYIYTTDIAAGEGAETVLASEGYDDAVTFVNGFRFIDDLLEEG
jgi:predicted nucleic acid-binding protein